MKRHHRWLQGEIETWRREGIIDDAQALRLAGRYGMADQHQGWSRFIFSALGAVLLGLGVILFFAYNWQEMGRASKLALIFSGISAAHVSGWLLSVPGRGHENLGECLHLLGTMLFGAGIWLVSQIYHMDAHTPNAFLVWSLAALAMAWAMPSIAQAMLAVLLMFFWNWFEVIRFNTPVHWGPWIVAGPVIGLAWTYRSRTLLFFSCAMFIVSFSLNAAHLNDDAVLPIVLALSSVCLGVAHLAAKTRFPQSASALFWLGNFLYLLLLFLLTFGDMGGVLSESDLLTWPVWLYWGSAAAVALLAWCFFWIAARERMETRDEIIEAAMIFIALLIVVVSPVVGKFGQHWWFSLLFFGHGVIWLVRGMHQLRWQPAALGGGMLAALILARFVDLFDSLLIRSMVFLILGAGLFAVGMIFSRSRNRASLRSRQVSGDSVDA
jgi:uncharacterized membrane protein